MKEGATRRKEQREGRNDVEEGVSSKDLQGGGRNEEEGVMRRYKRRGGRSDEEEGATRHGMKKCKKKKPLEDASLSTSVLLVAMKLL